MRKRLGVSWVDYNTLVDSLPIIANYFDIIGGTSTGGLVTTMLIAPNQDDRPLFATKDITKFYLDESPKIFPQSRYILMKKPNPVAFPPSLEK